MEPGEDLFGYGIKSTLVQCLVLTTAYFLNVQQGIDIMMPTSIIGDLNKTCESENITIPMAIIENLNRSCVINNITMPTATIEDLDRTCVININNNSTMDCKIFPRITKDQISWIGSLVYVSPPIGSLLLLLVQARFGHRLCMAITNVIQLSSVLVVIVFPNAVITLYMCSILMGLSTGFATGLSISYSGEVCDPKLRGSLSSALNVFYYAGMFFVNVAYAITKNWKKSLIITVAVPLTNMITLLMTPDSPVWLLSRGKTDKAKKVLRMLRGYASEEKCAKEFQEMVQYVSKSTKLEETKKKPPFIGSFSHPGLWAPLKLMLIYIFFSNIMSGVPYQPYLLSVIGSFNAPIDKAWAMTIYTAFNVIGNVFTILLVHRMGKRCLVLSTVTVTSLAYLLIGFIGRFGDQSQSTSWIKLTLFFTSALSASLGIMPIGWILVSEVFPMKSKNLGCSICSGVYFFLMFFMAKFYNDLEDFIGFYNTFLLFGSTGIVGLVYFYFRLPETENKTLKDIAEHFKPGHTPSIPTPAAADRNITS